MTHKFITGTTFGELTIIKEAEGRTKQGRKRWVCQCACGNESIVDSTALVSGNTKSCGKHGHGMTNHPVYKSYIGAQARCNYVKDKEYARYGGRGIEFRFASPEQFIEAMKDTWFEGATLGRVDVNGHYELGNVRWETRKEQAQNRRSTVMLTHNGETMTQSDWAKRLGVPDCSIAYRVKYWGADKALSKPFKK